MADVSDFDERMSDGHFEAKWTGRPKVLRPEPIVPPAPDPEVPVEPAPDPELDTFITEGGSISINEMGDDLIPE